MRKEGCREGIPSWTWVFGPAYKASRALPVGLDLHVGKRVCKEVCERG